jgi:hypothetical protein
MQEHKNFMLPPVTDEMRRRLDEVVGRVAKPSADERPPRGGDEALGTRPTYFAWMLRADR